VGSGLCAKLEVRKGANLMRSIARDPTIGRTRFAGTMKLRTKIASSCASVAQLLAMGIATGWFCMVDLRVSVLGTRQKV
jgi:hypothetical protein